MVVVGAEGLFLACEDCGGGGGGEGGGGGGGIQDYFLSFERLKRG